MVPFGSSEEEFNQYLDWAEEIQAERDKCVTRAMGRWGAIEEFIAGTRPLAGGDTPEAQSIRGMIRRKARLANCNDQWCMDERTAIFDMLWPEGT